jgi:hypothetical protein
MKMKILLAAVALMLSILVTGFSLGKRITLVANEDIQVMLLPTGDKAIGVIQAGQTVDVLGCEDMKHYIVPKVQLPDGNMGYVLDGKFHLLRHSAWRLSAGALSFSCS